MIVLDTTVLMYAAGGEHALRGPCRDLIDAIGDRRVEASTTVEVIQEFAHVYARRRTAAAAAVIAEQYVDLLAPLIDVRESALRAGLRLFAESDRLGAFDAVLVAAADSPAVGCIVSADRGFATAANVTHVFPDASGVRGLVA